MPPVTADTNVYVSGLQFGGVPMRFLSKALAEEFRLAVSEPILTEVRRVLRDKFAWSGTEIAEALSQLANCTTLVHPTRTIDAVPTDPDDNRVLECAVEAGSAYIVTGDNDLLRLGSFEGILMVRPADFLALLPPAL